MIYEKLKTAALTLLVLLSLLQSYMLAYSDPNPEPVTREEYVKTDQLGPQAKLEDLLFPDHLVLHLGNATHTVVYPNTKLYGQIVETVNQRWLEGFRKVSASSLGINWDDVRMKQQGVEIHFRDGIPMKVLGEVMQLKGEIPADADLITRIWLYAKDANEVRTILFTDTTSTVYEVGKADFTVKDIERFVTVGEEYIPYKATSGEIYLPLKPLNVSAYRMPFTQFSAEQLKRSFFVDPAITRNLADRDGSEIYTDGKRGLQLKTGQHWLTYSDPVVPVEGRIDVMENLTSAVQFVNQHGGWYGTYTVQRVPQRVLPVNQAFIFRQYYESFPVINQKSDQQGFIKLALQKGIVTNYERSTIIPDLRAASRKDAQLAGGEALEEKLKEYSKRNTVYSVFPAYRMNVVDQAVELVPAWTVELRDGSYEFME
ncbi:two-component system activity regulator YycH [Paenibacillus sp. GD4]|uniref:YycH family regulatory protein n=1 Tax=Paenibacillus sp. GD4 TaxID=3068890 RepID=UPI0027968164|nr:two-component system activity regulator YycH [Paenibacillus sp. GD4]MDQ1911151.1 two-component system activity regulator YycH [Paenibacillus sp. GD4]